MNLLERNEVIRSYLRGLSAWDREHAERVAVYSVAVAVEMKVSSRQLLSIRYAATLHGIGADETSASPNADADVRAPKANTRLQEEGALMRLPFLRSAGKIVAAYRGSGEIPLAARIVSACEAFDRLAHGLPGEDPWATLVSPAFDPEVVAALRRVADLIQPIGT